MVSPAAVRRRSSMQTGQTVAPGSSVTATPSDGGPDEPAGSDAPAASTAPISCCTVRRSCPSPEISRRCAVPNPCKSAWEWACGQARKKRCARPTDQASATAPSSGATAVSLPNAKRSGVPRPTTKAVATRAPPNPAHSQSRQRDGRTMTDTAQCIRRGDTRVAGPAGKLRTLPPAPEHHRCRTTSGQCTGLQKRPSRLTGMGLVRFRFSRKRAYR